MKQKKIQTLKQITIFWTYVAFWIQKSASKQFHFRVWQFFLVPSCARLRNLTKMEHNSSNKKVQLFGDPFPKKNQNTYSKKRVSPHCAWCRSGPPLLWTWQLNRPSTTYTVHQSWKLDEQSARAFLAKLTDLSEMFLGHCRSVRADAQYSTVAVLRIFCPKLIWDKSQF